MFTPAAMFVYTTGDIVLALVAAVAAVVIVLGGVAWAVASLADAVRKMWS